jgi:hypothetical protein
VPGDRPSDAPGSGARATVTDYDNDGWPDIPVTSFGRNVLYHNLGDGRFADAARQAGVEAPGWNTGAAFLDADGDGWLGRPCRALTLAEARC